MSLPDDKQSGLAVIRPDPESVLVPFRDNVTLNCNSGGRKLRGTVSSGFRQCVYDPKPVSQDENHLPRKSTNSTIFSFRVYRTTGYPEFCLPVHVPTVALRCRLPEPNTDNMPIPGIRARSSSVARTPSSWPARLPRMIMWCVVKPTAFGTLVIFVAKDPFARILAVPVMESKRHDHMNRDRKCYSVVHGPATF